jgi:UDP-glucose 4-epimerase
MLTNDTLSSVRIFEAAEKAGVQHLIYTSSTAALGFFQPHMIEEITLHPSDYYGATKASTEAFLSAFSHRTPMRCNVVRPGYTIGNPAVEGGPIYSDRRFKDIVKSALAGSEIRVVKNDGTQFVWAGDLARIYSAILGSTVNNQVYFGLSNEFTTWEAIANEAVAITQSTSQVTEEDKGYGPPNLFDLGKVKAEFGLEFSSKATISDHLRYLVANLS